MRMLAVLGLACACSKGDGDGERKATADHCGSFATAIAKRLAPTTETKNPMMKYVRAELTADLTRGLNELCVGKLPIEHIKCVVRAPPTLDHADQCPLGLGVAETEAFRDGMQSLVLAAVERAMKFPATYAECSVSAEHLQKGIKRTAGTTAQIPPPSAFAERCKKDKWDAAFVRCFNERKSTQECRSQPIVQDGLRELVGAPPTER